MFFFSPKWWKQRDNKETGVNQKQMNKKLEFKTWNHLTWDQSDRALSVAEEEEEDKDEEHKRSYIKCVCHCSPECDL